MPASQGWPIPIPNVSDNNKPLTDHTNDSIDTWIREHVLEIQQCLAPTDDDKDDYTVRIYNDGELQEHQCAFDHVKDPFFPKLFLSQATIVLSSQPLTILLIHKML